jgi:hypothetical protein
MRFAGRVDDPDVAQRLRLMAGEYLVKAEEEESQSSTGARLVGEAAHAPGVDLPAPNPEAPEE